MIEPRPTAEREKAIDALRGVALFGVLVVNAITIFRIGLFEQFVPRDVSGDVDVVTDVAAPLRAASMLDSIIGRVITLGFEFKAFTLFSFLFGVGLAAQRERTTQRGGVAFGRLAVRRLAFLLVLGLTHLFLVWNGDILTLYAILGLLAVPLLRLPTRALLAIALALFVVQVMPLPYPPLFPSTQALQMHVEMARHIYPYGSFREVLAFRIVEVKPIAVLLLWSAPRTLGLFLLGACAWRARIYHLPSLRLSILALLAIGLGGLGVWFARSTGPIGTWAAIVLGLGYGAAIMTAFRSSFGERVLSLFVPIGRMALTSYLTQSIVLGFIFYGYGLGLFDQLGEARALAIVIVIFAMQVVFATLWLRRFRFGPIEWVWRSFTYGAMQPMRRARSDDEQTSS